MLRLDDSGPNNATVTEAARNHNLGLQQQQTIKIISKTLDFINELWSPAKGKWPALTGFILTLVG